MRIVLVIEGVAYQLNDKRELQWGYMTLEDYAESANVLPSDWVTVSKAEIVSPSKMAERELIKAALETAETSQL